VKSKLLIGNQKMTTRILFSLCPVTGAQFAEVYNQFDCVISVKSPKKDGEKKLEFLQLLCFLFLSVEN